MHDSLIKYINNYISNALSNRDIERIKIAFVPKKIRKKQYLLQEGEVCKYIAFIVKGAMRQYTVDNKGIEHIVGLYIENWWAADRESFVMLTPSIYNIDAWEDTEALILTRADQVNLFTAVPALNELSLKLDQRHAFATQKRLNDFVSLPAEKRYTQFEKAHPDFLQRFPQHIIASYLGITKETLSRLRKQMMKK
jgi:CRP-like cAMP-binding protein